MNPFREKSRESFARRLRISVLLPTTSSTRTLKHAMPQRVHANNTSSPIRLHSQRIKVATAHFHLAALPRRPSLHGIITPTHRSAQGFLCFSRPFASAHFRPSAAMSSREDAHHYVRWSVRLHRALRGRRTIRWMVRWGLLQRSGPVKINSKRGPRSAKVSKVGVTRRGWCR